VEWILLQWRVAHVVEYMHYFLVAGPVDAPTYQDSVTEMHTLGRELGLPLEMDKAHFWGSRWILRLCKFASPGEVAWIAG
jgi:hypothetical protein